MMRLLRLLVLALVMAFPLHAVQPDEVLPDPALESRSAEGASLLSRVGNLSRLWRRSTGVPAPIVVAAS